MAPEFSPARVVNLAGQWFVSAYPWAWLERPATGLDFVAGQDYVTLPADFAEVRSVVVDNLTSSFSFTTSSVINHMRAGSVDLSGLAFWAALNYDSDAVPRLDIFPTPNANETDALLLYYRAGWTDLNDDTDQVKIPPFCEPAFIDVLRAFAQGYEEDGQGSVSQRLAELKVGTLGDAIAQDKRGQSDYGPLMNGAAGMSYITNDADAFWAGFQLELP